MVRIFDQFYWLLPLWLYKRLRPDLYRPVRIFRLDIFGLYEERTTLYSDYGLFSAAWQENIAQYVDRAYEVDLYHEELINHQWVLIEHWNNGVD